MRHVLIERLDRFAREISVQIALLGMLQREGITLIEATTGRDACRSASFADPLPANHTCKRPPGPAVPLTRAMVAA